MEILRDIEELLILARGTCSRIIQSDIAEFGTLEQAFEDAFESGVYENLIQYCNCMNIQLISARSKKYKYADYMISARYRLKKLIEQTEQSLHDFGFIESLYKLNNMLIEGYDHDEIIALIKKIILHHDFVLEINTEVSKVYSLFENSMLIYEQKLNETSSIDQQQIKINSESKYKASVLSKTNISIEEDNKETTKKSNLIGEFPYSALLQTPFTSDQINEKSNWLNNIIQPKSPDKLMVLTSLIDQPKPPDKLMWLTYQSEMFL